MSITPTPTTLEQLFRQHYISYSKEENRYWLMDRDKNRVVGIAATSTEEAMEKALQMQFTFDVAGRITAVII